MWTWLRVHSWVAHKSDSQLRMHVRHRDLKHGHTYSQLYRQQCTQRGWTDNPPQEHPTELQCNNLEATCYLPSTGSGSYLARGTQFSSCHTVMALRFLLAYGSGFKLYRLDPSLQVQDVLRREAFWCCSSQKLEEATNLRPTAHHDVCPLRFSSVYELSCDHSLGQALCRAKCQATWQKPDAIWGSSDRNSAEPIHTHGVIMGQCQPCGRPNSQNVYTWVWRKKGTRPGVQSYSIWEPVVCEGSSFKMPTPPMAPQRL